MGTGVGEAMLIGAAVGATTGGAGAAIQGGDPMKGALMGGAMGAVGGGIGSAFTPAAQGAVGAEAVAGQLGVQGAATGVNSQAGMLAAQNTGFGLEGLQSISGAASQAIPTTAAAPGAAGITAGMPVGQTPITPSMAAPDPASLGYKPNIFGYQPGEQGYLTNTQLGTIGGSSALSGAMQAERAQYGMPADEEYTSTFDPSKFRRSEPTYAPGSVYVPSYKDYTTAAEGGIMQAYQSGGPVERMTQMNTAMNPQGGLYPQGMIDKTQYATPTQRPTSLEMLESEPAYQKSNPLVAAAGMNGGGIAEILESAKNQGLSPDMYQNIYGRGNKIIEMQKALKEGKMVDGMAQGGISSLGGYSDGGRMLKGPGDGMSDSIPGVIGGRQPARLADGEFVVPADVVSHLGNGSTDAGAKRLYGMMDKVRKARTGKKKQAPAVKADKYMPA
jgi:hypothetical protein